MQHYKVRMSVHCHTLGAHPDAILDLVCLLLLYAMTAIFQLNLGGDMMYVWDEEKSRAYTFYPTQRIFNLPYHTAMEREELSLDVAMI